MKLKALGIVRKLDELGRIVIPKEVRDAQGWKKGEAMEMFVSGNKLVIQSYEDERKRDEMITKLKRIQQETNSVSNQVELEEIISYLKNR